MGYCRNNGTIDLYQLQKNFGRKNYLIPDWQREDAWSSKKKKEFEETLRLKFKTGETDTLPGCIILYEIEGQKGTFISDGLQRTRNSQRLFEKISREVGEAKAEEMFQKIKVPELTMMYSSEMEAKLEFRRINRGTPLTPKEEAKTFLTELKDFQDWKLRIFDPIHQSVLAAQNQFGIKVNKKRERKHSSERDNYAMFLRFLSKEQEMCGYSFDISGVDCSEKQKNKVLEQKLVNELKEIGIDEGETLQKQFSQFIIENSVFLNNIWKNHPKQGWPETIQTITPGCWRILLHLCIWRKNNKKDVPMDRFKKFIGQFFDISKGSTSYTVSEGRPKHIAKADLKRFRNVQITLDYIIDPTLDENKRKKRITTNQTSPGYDISHDNSFAKSEVDNSDLFIQSSIINKSNGILPNQKANSLPWTND